MHGHEVTARMVMAEISGQKAAAIGSKNAGSINNSFPLKSMVYMTNNSFHYQINFEKQAPMEEAFPILYVRKLRSRKRWPQVR